MILPARSMLFLIPVDPFLIAKKLTLLRSLYKEALAVVFVTDHFRAYLLGRKFPLFTDHSALHWLNSLEPKGHLGCWVMALQEYSFDVQHRPGISHGNADAFLVYPLTPLLIVEGAAPQLAAIVVLLLSHHKVAYNKDN